MSGNGTGSSGSVEGDVSISAGINGETAISEGGVVVTVDFLLQQLLAGSGVTCAIGVVGVDGVGVDGDEDSGNGLLLLQQPFVSNNLGARGRSDSTFFLFLETTADSSQCQWHRLKRGWHHVPEDILGLELLLLFFFVAPTP